SEPIHEKTDPRPGCSYHLGEGLLADLGDHSLGHTFLAEASQQQQNPSWPFFARIKELVNQVFFITNVPCQQISYKQIGEHMFPVKRKHHCLLVNAQKFAVCHGGCGPHAQRLSSQAAFSEKVSLAQY